MDGSRWQDVFAGLDESLLRDSSPKGADITASPAYRRFWAPTPVERREKLMPFLWRTLALRRPGSSEPGVTMRPLRATATLTSPAR